jgi:broad specificity phosphatase PhoE
MNLHLFHMMLLLFLPVFVSGAEVPEKPLLQGERLVEALRQGGYILYFRHAPTDWTQNDRVAAAGDWRSCDPAEMRQLSSEGRELAERIGAAMRKLSIPVGRVFSSEYCRARQTAQAFAFGEVTPSLEIMNMRAAEFSGGRVAVAERARRALSTSPESGTNTVWVAHGNVLRAATGVYTGEAGSVIFSPRGDGTVKLVGRLSSEDWLRLARHHSAEKGEEQEGAER